jgi:hypothetical protein
MASTKREDEIEKMLEDCGRGLECITEFVIDQPKIPSVVLDHLDNLHCLLEKLEDYIFEQKNVIIDRDVSFIHLDSEPKRSLFRWW